MQKSKQYLSTRKMDSYLPQVDKNRSSADPQAEVADRSNPSNTRSLWTSQRVAALPAQTSSLSEHCERGDISNQHANETEISPDTDFLAPLPAFNNNGKKRLDPRRQSTAIFNRFEEMSGSSGLLGDGELALGDDDILIPLTKTSALNSHAVGSTLWVDPDMAELMEENLPEPSLEKFEPAPASIVKNPARKPAVADSISLLAGFASICDNEGLETADIEAFLRDEDPSPTPAFTQAEACAFAVAKTADVDVLHPQPREVVTSVVSQQPTLRPSRLRPPSSSSAFFSKTLSNGTGSAAVARYVCPPRYL
jgi:hypothetical protein